MLWSPCVYWEDCDNCQLSWLGSQMRTQSSFWKRKKSEVKNIFYQISERSEIFFKLTFFFHFYCLYYLGENETSDHYWFLKHVARGTWEDGAVGEVKPQVWPSGKLRGKMIGSWDLTDQPAWQNQWPLGSEEPFLKLKIKVQSNEARHPKSN